MKLKITHITNCIHEWKGLLVYVEIGSMVGQDHLLAAQGTAAQLYFTLSGEFLGRNPKRRNPCGRGEDKRFGWTDSGQTMPQSRRYHRDSKILELI